MSEFLGNAAIKQEQIQPIRVENRCYTVMDLQTILGIGRKSVYELLKKKEFRWFQIGHGVYRISRKSFDDWLDSQN